MVEVQPRGALAVLVPASTRVPDAALRVMIVAEARRHGFTHVAYELLDDTTDPAPIARATVSGD
jgi:hypothetical protein